MTKLAEIRARLEAHAEEWPECHDLYELQDCIKHAEGLDKAVKALEKLDGRWMEGNYEGSIVSQALAEIKEIVGE